MAVVNAAIHRPVPVPTTTGRRYGHSDRISPAGEVDGQTTVRHSGSMAALQDVPHGTLIGWQSGCRCTCCSAAGAAEPAPAQSLEDIRRALTDAAPKSPDRPPGS
jgi:hypothetical protein